MVILFDDGQTNLHVLPESNTERSERRVRSAAESLQESLLAGRSAGAVTINDPATVYRAASQPVGMPLKQCVGLASLHEPEHFVEDRPAHSLAVMDSTNSRTIVNDSLRAYSRNSFSCASIESICRSSSLDTLKHYVRLDDHRPERRRTPPRHPREKNTIFNLSVASVFHYAPRSVGWRHLCPILVL